MNGRRRLWCALDHFRRGQALFSMINALIDRDASPFVTASNWRSLVRN